MEVDAVYIHGGVASLHVLPATLSFQPPFNTLHSRVNLGIGRGLGRRCHGLYQSQDLVVKIGSLVGRFLFRVWSNSLVLVRFHWGRACWGGLAVHRSKVVAIER